MVRFDTSAPWSVSISAPFDDHVAEMLEDQNSLQTKYFIPHGMSIIPLRLAFYRYYVPMGQSFINPPQVARQAYTLHLTHYTVTQFIRFAHIFFCPQMTQIAQIAEI